MRDTDAQVRARVVNLATAGSGSESFGRKCARNADMIYGLLAGDAGLFCKAFFGYRKSENEARRLRRLWARAQRIAEAP